MGRKMIKKEDLDRFSIACINKFPKLMHEIIAIEEFSEIIKPIAKLIRNPNDEKRIVELIDEIADCRIMLNTITILYGIKEFDIQIKLEEKINRGYNRIIKSKL